MQYIPNKWLSNRNVQTIWPKFFQNRLRLATKNRRLELPDGDFLDLSYLKDIENAHSSNGIVLIFHGLGGSIHSHYVLPTMYSLQRHTLTPIFVHFRGASEDINNKPYSYHAGKADDINFVINKIKSENPNKNLFAVGFSIGGSVLINYAGKYCINNPLNGIVTISVPFDLTDIAINLNKGFAKVYQHYLLSSLKNSLQKKFKIMASPIDLNRALNASNFFEYDDAATAPLNNFANVSDYYTQCSAKQYLKYIKTPTLLIHSKDDPFMSDKSIPNNTELSESITFELHDKGGHVGFIEGQSPWNTSYYLERRIPHYFNSFL